MYIKVDGYLCILSAYTPIVSMYDKSDCLPDRFKSRSWHRSICTWSGEDIGRCIVLQRCNRLDQGRAHKSRKNTCSPRLWDRLLATCNIQILLDYCSLWQSLLTPSRAPPRNLSLASRLLVCTYLFMAFPPKLASFYACGGGAHRSHDPSLAHVYHLPRVGWRGESQGAD